MDPNAQLAAWQSQPAPAVRAGPLLDEVRRDARAFDATIFRRDAVEVGTALLMAPAWVLIGVTQSLPWTWYLMVPSLLWVAGFLLADRRRRPAQPADPAAPLAESAAESLARVEHQIRLLRGVAWWYLLPLAVPMLAYVAQVNWRIAGNVAGTVAGTAVVAALLGLIFYGVYWLNQTAVRNELEPRRQKLRALLDGLRDAPAAEPPP